MAATLFQGFAWICVSAAAWLAAGSAGAAESPDTSGSAGIAPAAEGAAPRGDSPLQSYRRHYEEALAKGEFLEAEAAAKGRISHLLELDQRGYRPMANALSDLAFAQRQRELYEPALRNYHAAIELLESGENRLSGSLLAPLRALAETYVASGRPDLALPVYQRALHIRHVNDGPHTLEQIDLLDAMVPALLGSGDVAAALDVVDRIYYLYARAYAPESAEVLPALERKAGLLNELGRHDEERRVYRDIVNIIEDRRGEHDLRLFDTYLALGHTYFYDLDEVYFRSEPTTETGETFFERALELAQSNPEATWQMEARALLALADYYTLRDVQDLARIHYRQAWALLSGDGQRLAMRRRELGRVHPLLGVDLDAFSNFGDVSSEHAASPGDYEDGYVIVRFTVTDRGRVIDVEIADAEPGDLAAMETHILQAVRDLVYRPRYDDGRPVSTSGQLFRHDFLYLAGGLQAARDSGQ